MITLCDCWAKPSSVYAKTELSFKFCPNLYAHAVSQLENINWSFKGNFADPAKITTKTIVPMKGGRDMNIKIVCEQCAFGKSGHIIYLYIHMFPKA